MKKRKLLPVMDQIFPKKFILGCRYYFRGAGLVLLLLAVLLFSCRKEGPGGKGSINGYVKHLNRPIPRAIVYIKYGTQKFPGNNVTYYDANVIADANAHYEFADLKRGDYYLFSVGFDSSAVVPVSGSIPVVIKNKTETVTADITVTE
jgi:hypothetical protein